MQNYFSGEAMNENCPLDEAEFRRMQQDQQQEAARWVEINAKPIAELTDRELSLTCLTGPHYVSDARRTDAQAEASRRRKEAEAIERTRVAEAAARRAELDRQRRLAAAEAKFCGSVGRNLLIVAWNEIVLAGPDQVEAIKRFDEWGVDPSRPFLVIFGPTGTGKTVLASRLFWLTMQQTGDYSGVDHAEFWDESDLITKWREAAARKKSFTGKRLRNAALLVLDDLGNHAHNQGSHDLFFGIINHRYKQGLKAIFTTNKDPKQMAEALGTKLASRLFDRERRVLVSLGGADIRLTGFPRAVA
jgi:DNA replication protein DnaC